MTTPFPSNSERFLQLLSESELVRIALDAEYEILDELGRGGMAVVYRARERTLDREVAIKILPARLAVDNAFVERFEHEARTAAKLEHPNIVPIYRVGRAGPNGEVIYFVMKLLRGQSLSAVLKERGRLEPAEVRRILMETAAALGYAAKRSVVHRDIKPDNILLDSEGRCVITDFGIAKAPGGQNTAAGRSLGTPLYMSPEHASGSPLDGRSDMYSLGIVAYKCLIGTTPFSSEDPFTVLYRHINEPLPEPTLTTDDERQLYAVIARMLAKKPDDRYQTANELNAALGGQISDPTLVASMITGPGLMAPTEMIPTPQSWYRTTWNQLSRRRRRIVVGAGVLAAAGIVGLMIGQRQGASEPAPAAVPNSPPSVAAAPAAAQPVNPTPPPAPLPSPRAVAIIAYNKVRSNCPRLRDTLTTTKPIEYAVLVDSVPDRLRSAEMEIRYDVCGLSKGSPFTVLFTLNKLHQRPVRPQKPHSETTIETAASPRLRKRQKLDMREMSAGDYRLDVTITDGQKREVTAIRAFKISDK